MTDKPSDPNNRLAQAADVSTPQAGPAETESLLDTFRYGLSLPERTARAASAVVGGIAQETAGWMLPAAFRSSKTYSAFVQESLNVLIHDLGGVPQQTPASDSNEEGKLAQKAVSGLLDLIGSSTMHLSPIMVFGRCKRCRPRLKPLPASPE